MRFAKVRMSKAKVVSIGLLWVLFCCTPSWGQVTITNLQIDVTQQPAGQRSCMRVIPASCKLTSRSLASARDDKDPIARRLP